MKQVAQRGGTVFIYGNVENPTEHDLEQLAVTDLAWAGRWTR